MEDIIQKHRENRNVVSVLQSIQAKYGYIPEKEASEICKALEIPLVKLWGVTTFYAQFKLEKRGKYLVSVCNGTACHINHSMDIIEALKDHLKLKPGETTKDGMFTLQLVNCIGACARSPAMMINGVTYGRLTPKSAKKVIEDMKANG